MSYKHNMTTNKQNQDRTGLLSMHNFFIIQLSQRRSSSSFRPTGVVGRRKALTLPQYQSQIRVIRGQDNVGADCLSRNPLEEGEDEATVCKSS